MSEEKTNDTRLVPEVSYKLSPCVYADCFKCQEFSGDLLGQENDFRTACLDNAVKLEVGKYSDLVRGTVLSIERKDDHVMVVSTNALVERLDCPDLVPAATDINMPAPHTYTSSGYTIVATADCSNTSCTPTSPLAGRKIVIGMIGRAGSGKDTVADYLVRTCGFKKIAFADPLKKAVQIIFDVDDDIAYDRVKREEPLEKWPGWSFRKLLQYVGTEMFRNMVDQDIWVKNCASRATRQDLSVISDVRFPNEVKVGEHIGPEYKTIFVKVERAAVVNGAPSGIANHASEVQVDNLPYDHLIANDGTLEDLYRKVDELIARIDSEV